MKSYEVQIWEIAKRADRKARPWRVRWAVSGQRFEDMFRTKALAHSFRAELVQAANAGEPFDPATGRPVSEARTKNPTTWYAHSRAYVEMKWPRAAAKTRRSIVEALTSITVTLTRPAKRGRPTDALLREALYLYGLNPRRWSDEIPADHAAALAWLETASLPVVELDSPAMVRPGPRQPVRTPRRQAGGGLHRPAEASHLPQRARVRRRAGADRLQPGRPGSVDCSRGRAIDRPAGGGEPGPGRHAAGGGEISRQTRRQGHGLLRLPLLRGHASLGSRGPTAGGLRPCRPVRRLRGRLRRPGGGEAFPVLRPREDRISLGPPGAPRHLAACRIALDR